MAKSYVVWIGRQTGVFDDWPSCQRQVDKFPGAKFLGFGSRAEAEAAFAGKSAVPPPAPKKTKKPSESEAVALTAEAIAAHAADVKIFSDGACVPNPGEAGTGLAVYREGQLSELWYGLYNPAGTNNTAELMGFHHALLTAKEELGKGASVAVFCDSQYSIKCVTQWAVKWKKNGWKKVGGDIKNLELIQRLHALYEGLKGAVEIFHVKGHAGIEGNELADRMSALAIEAEEKELRLFAEPLSINEILAMRSG